MGLFFGVAIATPAAWTLVYTFKRSTIHVQVFDPIVYGIAAAIVLIVSLFAMYLPAFRATQVDPMQALRNE
jgi:ABC-type antimicrobial peptide transport system permease subunit